MAFQNIPFLVHFLYNKAINTGNLYTTYYRDVDIRPHSHHKNFEITQFPTQDPKRQLKCKNPRFEAETLDDKKLVTAKPEQ